MGIIDLTGQTFGHLRAIAVVGRSAEGLALWECLCAPELGGCGAASIANSHSLRRGNTKSCGCRGTKADLTGRRFGRLVAIARAATREGELRVPVRCDCGVEKDVSIYSLLRGDTQSCGCLRRDMRPTIRLTHGHARKGPKPPEYNTWHGMRLRCNNPNAPGFKHYGARGITVCSRWNRDYAAFFADMGPKPSRAHSLDRVDNDKGYWCGKAECPDCGPARRAPNCRWTTTKQQARNKRSNRPVTADGETMTIVEWSERTGIEQSTIAKRLRDGMPEERALDPADLRARRASGDGQSVR